MASPELDVVAATVAEQARTAIRHIPKSLHASYLGDER